MRINFSITRWLALAALAAFNLQPPSALAQDTAFTYQGHLNDNGSPASGIYDLRFTIYDAVSFGNVVSGVLTNAATPVVNGLFSVTLDFGTGAFTGPGRWLQLEARTNGGGAFTALLPRQQVLPTPYAIMANTASNLLGALPAAKLTGTIALQQLPPAVVTNGTTGVTLSGIFTGNGAGLTNIPSSGSGVAWQNVTGTSQQAQTNTGYLANNAAQVTITLPASPNLGDIVRVSGIGAGGWRIAQNAGQFVLLESLPRFMIPASWTAQTNGGPANWFSVASSADGTKLVGVTWPGFIYTSVNSGVTWAGPFGVSASWSSVASSADGTKLVATYHGGSIYTSANSGGTWTAQPGTGPAAWSCVASSSDGTKLVAAINTGIIYTSANSGGTWTPQNSGSASWTSVASSADGTKLVASVSPGLIYTSANSGVTWTPQNSGSATWSCVASSADGTRLVAAINNGQIYTSANSGVTWTPQNSGSLSWNSVACSADGTKLVAGTAGGAISTSSDMGLNWTAASTLSSFALCVDSSADGSKLVAGPNGGLINTAALRSTVGTAGYLQGFQHSAIELQYIGSGQFIPLSHEGAFSAY